MANVIILTDFTDSVFLTRILGPYKVAHELRKAGVSTVVINHLHMWQVDELEQTIESLINDQTLFVGVNNMYFKNCKDIDFYSANKIELGSLSKGQILPHGTEASARIAALVKKKNIPLVLGGPTALDRAYNENFDYLLKGFTETSIVDFVQHLQTGADLSNSYRSVFGPVVIEDYNQQQSWDFASSTMTWHEKDAVLPGETLSIEIARGCIFQCKFCSYPLIGKKKFDYIRHFDLIKQELLENYDRFGITRYYFSDETFNDSVYKLEMMHELSKSLPFDLEYFAYIRLDLVIKNPHTVRLLFDSGLRATHFGIETLHPAAGRAIGKKFSAVELTNVLKQFKQIGGDQINLHGSFIVGLPYESQKHVLQTYDMLKNQHIPLDSFVYFPLYIRRPGAHIDSLFSTSYQKYGYEIMPNSELKHSYLGKYPECVAWQNQHMNCVEAVHLAQQLDQQSFEFKRLGGLASFEIAGLGFDRSFFQGKSYNEIDWHAVVQQKISRFSQYKSQILTLSADRRDIPQQCINTLQGD